MTSEGEGQAVTEAAARAPIEYGENGRDQRRQRRRWHRRIVGIAYRELTCPSGGIKNGRPKMRIINVCGVG